MKHYYIEDDGARLHIYCEYSGNNKQNLGGIKWIATLTDRHLANWILVELNNKKLESKEEE